MPKPKVSAQISATYDVVVIGSGAAGIAALEGARAGGAKSLCLIESEAKLGGECVNWACVPTKAMLRAAKLYHSTKYGVGKYGIQTGAVSFNFSTLLRRRDAVMKALTDDGRRLTHLVKSLKATIKRGQAQFISHNLLLVKGERIRAKAIVIATGSRERRPEIAGLDETAVWFSHDVVSMQRLPSSVAIVGGGPVGSEFATLFGMLGVKTLLLEAGEQILPREDGEIASLAEAALQELGVKVLTRTRPLGLKPAGKAIKLTYQAGRQPRRQVQVDKVIIAVGRTPNLTDLALDKAKVQLDEYERLKLGPHSETSQAHIFAAGDAASRYQFTHIAAYEGYLAGWNAANLKSPAKQRRVVEKVVPRITFVNPEIASVGMTMIEAKKLKRKFKTATLPFAALGRAAIDGNRTGLIKVLVENNSGLILGAHVLGERAGEIVHELALAMNADLTFAEVQAMLHAYPSWSEAISAASF